MATKRTQRPTSAMGEAQKSLQEMMETIRPFTEPERPKHVKRPTRWVSGGTSEFQSCTGSHQRHV